MELSTKYEDKDVILRGYDNTMSNREFEAVYKPVNISEIRELKVKDKNGKYLLTINPRQIAAQCNFLLQSIKTNRETNILSPYLTKKIIWSFRAGTAFTDGIRIAMSPIFAHQLLAKGRKELKAQIASIEMDSTLSVNAQIAKKNHIHGRYFQYVIIHEIYHQLYNHLRREKLKLGKTTKHQHAICNIAMDMEINRDIEAQYQSYSGCTEAIGGVWFQQEKFKNKEKNKFFTHETWEDIYDYLITHESEFIEKSKQNKATAEDPKEIIEPHSEAYEKGWKAAIESITSREFDPMKVNI